MTKYVGGRAHISLECLIQKKKFLVDRIILDNEVKAHLQLTKIIHKLWDDPLKKIITKDKYVKKAAEEFGLDVCSMVSDCCWDGWQITIPGEDP